MNSVAPKHTKAVSFTPGPWRISGSVMMNEGIACPLISHGDSEEVSPLIAEVYADGGRLPREANARLISAAPDLLEICQNVLVAATEHGLFEGKSKACDWYIDRLDAAIEKAGAK